MAHLAGNLNGPKGWRPEDFIYNHLSETERRILWRYHPQYPTFAAFEAAQQAWIAAAVADDPDAAYAAYGRDLFGESWQSFDDAPVNAYNTPHHEEAKRWVAEHRTSDSQVPYGLGEAFGLLWLVEHNPEWMEAQFADIRAWHEARQHG